MNKMNKPSLGLRSLAKSLAWICCVWVAASFLCPPVLAMPGDSKWSRNPNGNRGIKKAEKAQKAKEAKEAAGGLDKTLNAKRYSGTAVVVRVEKTEAANAKKGAAAEGYEVWYTFTPTDKVPDGLGKNYLEKHKEHQFVLSSGGFCPGPKFLKKYGIKTGKKFLATLLVIEGDKSEPVKVEFKYVPNGDCFEAISQHQ